MEVDMSRSLWFTCLKLLFLTVLLTSCSSPQTTPAPANMPNPASVFCEQHGGRLEFKQDASGGVSGTCVFPDGSSCDEWAYFRGECQPGAAQEAPAPTAADNANDPAWKTYRNETLGYRLLYPAEAEIVMNDDPLKGFSIIGPAQDGNNWPSISISHPADREEYHPPKDANLESWLKDHNLLGAVRFPDIQIAGTTAIHFRHDRSPQSFAFDTYYFARAGQLYQIIIGHTGDKEDWKLYNHFLQSIRFE